uniref:Uncharacterized protein n=1 Tax=Setaria italica TaxID=4555 RepID=K3XTS7_SETIT
MGPCIDKLCWLAIRSCWQLWLMRLYFTILWQ